MKTNKSYKITKYQMSKIWGYVNSKNLSEKARKDMILSYTGGRTARLSEMTYDEAMELIEKIDIDAYKKIKADKMRKKILHLCHLMQWYEKGSTKLDFKRIDAFCIERGWKHKPLNAYTYSELPLLVTQFEEVYEHSLKKL